MALVTPFAGRWQQRGVRIKPNDSRSIANVTKEFKLFTATFSVENEEGGEHFIHHDRLFQFQRLFKAF